MKIKTSELTGAALDWAVAKCERVDDYILYESFMTRWGDDEGDTYQYSTDWAQGGPIIEREKIDVMWCGDRWCAYTMTPDGQSQLITEGETPLIAAMRGYVASKLGEEVEVPDDVLKDAELDALVYDRGDE
jgi:hypothetical protein